VLAPADDIVKSLSAEERRTYERLMQKAKRDDEFDNIEPGPDCISGSQLPSHSDINKSCLTNQRIVVCMFYVQIS